MNYKMLGLMSGLGKGIRDAGETLSSISVQKRKLEQDDKTFKTDMKIKKLQLEKLEGELDPETLKFKKDQMKLDIAAQKNTNEQTNLKLDRLRQGAEIETKFYETYMQGLNDGSITVMEDGTGLRMGNVEYNINKAIEGENPIKFKSQQPWEKDGLTKGARSKLIGELETTAQSGYKDKVTGEVMPETQESAIRFFKSKGYRSYEKDPIAMKIINSLPSEKETQPASYQHDSQSYKQKPKTAVEVYGYEKTQTITKMIKDLSDKGTSPEEIRELMKKANINPDLF